MRTSYRLLAAASAAMVMVAACNTPRADSTRQNGGQAAASATTETSATSGATAPAPSVAKVVSVEPAAGEMAPNFTWQGADGKTHSLAEMKGKVVLLNFWATWCPPCRHELPDIVKIRTELADKGLVVLGVNVAEQPPAGTDVTEHVAKFAASNGLDYPLVIANDDMISSYGGIEAVPTTFIIDRNGKIVQKLVGGRDLATFRSAVQPFL